MTVSYSSDYSIGVVCVSYSTDYMCDSYSPDYMCGVCQVKCVGRRVAGVLGLRSAALTVRYGQH